MLSNISSLPYYFDATLTKLLPGVLLDRVFPAVASSEWGKAKGEPELHDLTSLQRKKWYSPYELFRTESILAGRKSYYACAAKESFSQAVSDQATAIKLFVANQFPDSTDVTKKTIETNACNEMMKTWVAPSLTSYANHPHTRNRQYLVWGLRLGALYYFSPFESQALSLCFVALAAFPYSALLVPGARRELSTLRAPKVQKEFSLSENCKERIYADVERLAGTAIQLKDTLNEISFKITIADPFLNDRHFKAVWQQAKNDKLDEIEHSDRWYELTWKENTALIGYWECKNNHKEKSAVEKKRLDFWKGWKRTNKTEAISFWKKQTDVIGPPPEDTKPKSAVKILDRRRK